MLQRAASNTYSWWWASHIRTKQSKWLEQNLQDMEEKVHHALKLIEEDGDSFAKRAEMYYKKRPELINFVEESYRAYRALAERYDHISTELQNANNTIASVFPEQVQFAMDEEDEEASLRFSKRPAVAPKTSIPKVPKAPIADLKNVITLATKKLKPKKVSSFTSVAKSGLSKPEGLEKIDNLQKRVLTLQTEKEFVRSMYENEVAKYWEIEKQIKETQEEIFTLQDDFGENMVIEDEEARSLMATAALKSCQETLAELQKKQEQSAEQAKEESEKIREVKEKLESLQSEHNCDQFTQKELLTKNETPRKKDEPECLDQKLDIAKEEMRELEMLGEQIKDHSESNTLLTVTDMAEKIDELVLKVISLGTSVSSQTALVKRLSTETDELRAQVRTLEEDKATLIEGKIFLMNKHKEMERKFIGVGNQNQSFKSKKNNTIDALLAEAELQEANNTIDALLAEAELQEAVGQQNIEFKEMSPAKSEGTLQMTVLNQEESPVDFTKEIKKQENSRNLQDSASIADDASALSRNQDDSFETQTENIRDNKCKQIKVQKDQEAEEKKISSGENPKHRVDVQQTVQEEEPDWQQMFMNGLEGREKVLLSEYTTTLRNYKDVKKKLGDAEQKSQDSLIESSKQLRELKNGIAIKDEEIKSLRQKLILMQKCYENKDTKELQHSGYEELDVTANKVTPTEEKVNIDEILVDLPAPTSVIEEKFRTNIDELLEENLEFWLNFSTSFHEIQKFETKIQDLQKEVSKLEEKEKKAEGGSTAKYSLKSEARAIYKHLREIQTELTVWLEKSVALKDELQSRFSSLCNIQEEITAALKSSAEDDDFKFTSYQAAKFQGEVLNMKQENNKVAKELKAGIEYVTTLQHDIETTLSKMNEEFRLDASKRQDNPQLRPSESRNRVPLRSFIFGSKPRKQKPSIFSYVAPAMHRKYHGLRAASPL